MSSGILLVLIDVLINNSIILRTWAAAGGYATQGFLNIDNNVSERRLKRVAIGTTRPDELEQFPLDVWKREDAAEPVFGA